MNKKIKVKQNNAGNRGLILNTNKNEKVYGYVNDGPVVNFNVCSNRQRNC